MKEYISKDRAKQFVCGHCNEVCSEEPCEPRDCDWMAFIDKEPAADVVEVVRCRECLCYTPVDDNIGKCVFLNGKHQYVAPDGYCYLEELKEGVDNG